MPRVLDLGKRSGKLSGVTMIVGDGLCSNIYVVGRGKATVIDTGVGNSVNPVWPQLESIGVPPANVDKVVLTHAHHDHAMGVYLILERSDPKVFVHTKDTEYIASSLGDRLVKVEEGDVVETELWPLEVIWTPGHTEGGISLYAREQRILFSGDTVFPDGYYGRTDGESGSLEQLLESLRRLTELSVDVILAGHGMPVLRGAEENIRQAYRDASRWS